MSLIISIKIPAKVKNPETALAMVGGVDLISKVNTINANAAVSQENP